MFHRGQSHVDRCLNDIFHPLQVWSLTLKINYKHLEKRSMNSNAFVDSEMEVHY